LIIYIAPKIMGSSARPLLNVPEIDSMGDLFNMNITDCRSVGGDIRLTAVPIQTG
jgi:diaminohydroxyphosphoribosylaminopyrimidine deaminase/5-amino-6-(5-phosphoribosylamino)uracil reductase